MSRDIDTGLALLEGEAAGQQASQTAPPAAAEGAPAEGYYGRPLLKQPVWLPVVPLYFYVGGAAGAAMVVAWAAQMAGGAKLRRFEERCRWIGAIGGGIGSALLIVDLGRPERFLAMLRVFRPTSPMSVGSWVLATATPLSAGSALLSPARGWPRRVGNWLGVGAGITGMPLSCYTAVLLANTAAPAWQEARASMPVLFGASSLATFAAISKLLPASPREAAIIDRLAIAGAASDLAAGLAMEMEVSRVADVYAAYRNAPLWTGAKLLTAASLILAFIPGGRRWSGLLGAAAGLALRFAVFHAGKASTADPAASFRQQRLGFGGREVTGRPAVTSAGGR